MIAQLKFKGFLETVEEKFHNIQADIPLPAAVYTLSELFARQGASLFAVGGVIRDFLYSHHHGGKFSPKDVDLATEAPPEKVMAILSSPAALEQGIKTFPKGEAFGVISAVVDGEEYEIATFREDGQYTDGRRPDSVSFSTPAKDAQRRDLTYNALFYDIHKKEIRDYNLNQDGEGQGLQDIKNLVARPVGNARDRFREDKLRIPRLVRFFSRFNPGYIMQHLDKETLAAIEEFKDLAGVSPERIAAEFTGGLQKAASPVNYLKNYEATGLLPAVFPGLQVDMHDVDRIGNVKNIKAVLAWLLKRDDPKAVRIQLNRLKYANDVSDATAFLVRLYRFDVSQVAQLLKHRDLYKQLDSPELQASGQKVLTTDVLDFARISGKESELQHFLNYQPTVKSQDFTHLKGKAISDAMSGAEAAAYQRSNDEAMAGR
jgi:tRNA nucleotidyltransferase/poly(A) polymerase